MMWEANQIYTPYSEEMVATFQAVPFLANKLFHVDDLEGVRCEQSRKIVFNPDVDDERRRKRHGLPENGFLVACPEIYREECCDDGEILDPFAKIHSYGASWFDGAPPAYKWEGIDSPESVNCLFPAEFDQTYYSVGLTRLLKWASNHVSSPVLYYQCNMWAGDVEEETALGVQSRRQDI